MTTREAELEREVTHLRGTVAELHGVVAELRRQLDRQQAHLDRLVKMTFGRSSERVVGPTLFDGLEPSEPSDTPVSLPLSDPVAAPRRRGHGRRRVAPELPVERVVLDLADAEKPCPCCGTLRVRVGLSEPSRRHDYQPASVFVRETVRVSYACRACEQQGLDSQFTRPALPPEPIERSTAAAGLLAHVIVSKFTDHLPLHRQESILARQGWLVSRSTLCDHLRQCAVVLDPLYQAMIARVKQSFAIHADDTPVTLLRPRRTASAWVDLGDVANPFTVFDLTAGRSQEHPTRFLDGYRGYLQADAYAGYNVVHGGVRHVGCWMHARRGFHDARDQDPRACEALAFIRSLYEVARQAKDQGLSDTAVSRPRREYAKPVLDRFATWLTEHQRTALPSSGFGQAVSYAVNQWATLTRYVDDGRLAIDNGPAEQAVRPLAVGRNNWLFLGGDTGLSSASVLLSVLASVKRPGSNPWVDLRDVLTQLPARPPTADMSDLLPDRGRPRLDLSP